MNGQVLAFAIVLLLTGQCSELGAPHLLIDCYDQKSFSF
jgi:hypothetical protein